MTRYYMEYYKEIEEYAFMRDDKILFRDHRADVVRDVLERYAAKLLADRVTGLVLWTDLGGNIRINCVTV